LLLIRRLRSCFASWLPFAKRALLTFAE